MLSTVPFYLQQFHKDGEPLSGGKLYTYIGGSTNAPKATYVDPNGATESSNPIILSSQGICPQFWCEAGLYKFVLTDSSGNEIASRDYVDGIGGGAAITGDHKVMVNSSDTPAYLGSKVYADGGLVVQEVEVSPGTYKMHLFPDSSGLQAKPTGPAGGDLAGTYPDPIVKQLTGIEAALLPVASDFTFSTYPAGTGIGPGKQFVAGVEVRCWVAMDFGGRLRWTRNDFASTILDTGLWSRSIGSNWNCIRFLYMAKFSSWAWVAGDGVNAYVYYALHAPANYNTDGTIKAAAWNGIYYGGNPRNLGDIAQGASNVACFVGNDSYIGRTTDFATFTRASPGSDSLGGIDTDGFGAWLAIERDQGRLIESTDNGLTWAYVALISVDGSAADHLPVDHGEQWGSLNYGYGKWLAAVYNIGSGRISYAYSSDRRIWTTYTSPSAASFFSAAFDGRKWFATNPEASPPIWQLLFSEIPAHKRLICEDGLISSGSTFLPDLANAKALATDRNGLLVAQDWIDLSGCANASEYRVGGTRVIDSTRNVKANEVWTGGALRVNTLGDVTGRNATLSGWLALNGATRPNWGVNLVKSVQAADASALGVYSDADSDGMEFWANVYFDVAYKAVNAKAGNYPSRLSFSRGALALIASQTQPTAGGTVSDMVSRWSVNRFGGIGCFGVTPPTSRPSITGARGSASATAALLTALSATGLVLDSTTARTQTREAIIYVDTFNNTAPNIVNVVDANMLSYGFAGTGGATENLGFSVDMQHDYVNGTDITLHIHWLPNDATAGNVQWKIAYQWVENGAVWPAATLVNRVTAAAGVAYTDQRTDFVISGTGHTYNSRLKIKLSRTAADANDTYNGIAIFIAMGLHYTADVDQ